MKRFSIAVVVLAMLLLAACGAKGNPVGAGAGTKQTPSRFKSAGELIQNLNKAGVVCKPAMHPGLGPQIAGAIPGACTLSNGDRLTVLIVPNAAQAYQSQFAKVQLTGHVLYGANWVVIAPDSAPAQALQTIRDSFHARG
jgi:predicted small secreted protein